MKEKRNTIRKKMSNRDYANLLYFFETGEFEADLSEYDAQTLAYTEVRVMRLSAEEKERMDEFFKNKPTGSSFKSFLDTMPKATGYFQGVSIGTTQTPPVTQKQPAQIEDDSDDDEPETTLEAEPIRPKNLPHWVKDPLGKLEPDNIDVAEIARIVEEGEQSSEEMKAELLKLGTPDHPEKMLAAHPSEFEETLGDRYTYAVSLLDVIDFAAKKHARYVEIMTEEPPSEEENFERYFTYILSIASIPKHPNAYAMARDAEEVTSFSDNKIVFDNSEDTALEYEDASIMEHDLLHLVYRNKVGKETQVDVFGKKISALKIAQKLYKKYPHGLPDDKKFYYTRREAFEDGALEI